MILQMVKKYADIHNYLDFSFLNMQEPQNLFSEQKKYFQFYQQLIIYCQMNYRKTFADSEITKIII